MLPGEIKTGYILNYAYLWHWQALEGREDGDKDRPCLVLALVETTAEGVRFVRVLPITQSPPADPTLAVEIPAVVKRRLRLDHARSWIIVSESNRFAWPGPDLRPPLVETTDGYYGALPPALFAAVRDRFVALARGGAHASIGRTA